MENNCFYLTPDQETQYPAVFFENSVLLSSKNSADKSHSLLDLNNFLVITKGAYSENLHFIGMGI